ncbi:hypothetical protein D9613_000724 [Agrocybe pediades]|uniref:Zn(2)-C6 fungal-type domain-containing protein n=1 Tax=Agrocybe pediades TaxID=84607 RepID=A0A8H4R1V9_9AGAR|nr:hypothetical protein D9613_000724 [Agrocybe pediades]
MSSESANRKKRSSVSDSTPAPDGDHRKRRRNRTTQSCLNCHTSKRMCDRKRPACARCTQLGLTGLCVYEVDDPSQRTETQDESSRLLKRVAELEGVIRELKNKPHPRWVQSTSNGEDFEKWGSRPQTASEGSSSGSSSSPPMSSSSSERGDNSPTHNSTHPMNISKQSEPTFSNSIHPQPHLETRRKSTYGPGSPLNTPSPGLMTPTDEYPLTNVGIAGQNSFQDYDLSSMFLSYPGLIGFGDGAFPPVMESRMHKHAGGQPCNCLHEQTTYNSLLELSLRLRKASEVLSQSASHQIGGFCHLSQRISELDSLTINALSDISSQRGISENPAGNYLSPQMYAHRVSPSQRAPMMNARPWDMTASSANSPTSLDDSFMSWEPPRRS